MRGLGNLTTLVRADLAEWGNFRLSDLQFQHGSQARLFLVSLLGLALLLFVVRRLLRPQARPAGLVLPALLSSIPRSRAALLLGVPLLLFVAGLPFFVLALADPHLPFVVRQASFPGRRIGLMIDASMSMHRPFTAVALNRDAPAEAFFSTVAAAERFVQLRMKSQYRDLVALVEFGNRAYIITPFTNDYDNVLLSISLIGDPEEYRFFPDQGTIITEGIRESIELFRAFKFLEASGNIMVLFTDGEDSLAHGDRMTLDEILQDAVEAEIPVFMVRTNYEKQEGAVIPDSQWRTAVEKTGGRFYAASDEDSLLHAIQDIDRVSAGTTIDVKQYSSQQPRFALFALVAAGFWTTAAGLKLGVPLFQKLS